MCRNFAGAEPRSARGTRRAERANIEFAPTGVNQMYHASSPINGDNKPLCVLVGQPLNYEDMTDYIRSWPDKLVTFVADRLCDDDMQAFARELYEYICEGDRDGPAYEEWRKT